MYRYQTKSFGVMVPFNPAEVKDFWLTFVQNDILINKTKAQLADAVAQARDAGNGMWEFPLAFTQEESGDFSANAPVKVQGRWSNEDGHSDVTSMYSFWIKDVLMEGEI